ncbi:MAG: hypothetical protein JRJ49_10240 [Deltaproteobacteria bacterium]|nr:hypothetical protein [Deltaproteobacteria bacterium]
MIDKIINNSELFYYIRDYCEETDVSAEIDEKISEEDYIVLKIDKYYASLNLEKTPPSPDCLIIVKCKENNLYDLYLVELKNIKSPKYFEVKNIEDKFKTAVEDFMSVKFADIFLNKSYKINKFRIYFVTDAYRIKKSNPEITEEDYRKQIKNTKLKLFEKLTPIGFRGKNTFIDPRLPNHKIKYC